MLEEAIFYLPGKNVLQKVVDCQKDIRNIKNELHEIESSFWTRPTDIEQVQSKLRRIIRKDSFGNWIDSLPFPLASILWACHAEEKTVNYRELYERKFYFFEALTEFLAIVYISAFTNFVGWPSLLKQIEKILSAQSLSFKRSTWGTWKVVVECLSAQTRRLFGKEQDMCLRLFKISNPRLLESLTSERLTEVIQNTNKLRNDWHGHTGVVGEADAKAVDKKLSEYIESVRKEFGVCWENYELILPIDSTWDEKIYSYRIRKVMGVKTPFPLRTVEVCAPMKKGCLHLKSPDIQEALILIPLVKIMPSPKTAENACYFYNRQNEEGKFRFLSYHFEPDSEVIGEFTDVENLLSKLTQV